VAGKAPPEKAERALLVSTRELDHLTSIEVRLLERPSGELLASAGAVVTPKEFASHLAGMVYEVLHHPRARALPAPEPPVAPVLEEQPEEASSGRLRLFRAKDRYLAIDPGSDQAFVGGAEKLYRWPYTGKLAGSKLAGALAPSAWWEAPIGLAVSPKGATLACPTGAVAFAPVPAGAAKKLLAEARFLSLVSGWGAGRVARSEDGTVFYLDDSKPTAPRLLRVRGEAADLRAATMTQKREGVVRWATSLGTLVWNQDSDVEFTWETSDQEQPLTPLPRTVPDRRLFPLGARGPCGP